MKKIFMTLAATAVALGINAQAYVGGGLGVANISVDNGYSKDDATSFKFVPEVGYSFNEEWAAGVAFGWEGATKGGVKTLSVNPYARYWRPPEFRHPYRFHRLPAREGQQHQDEARRLGR